MQQPAPRSRTVFRACVVNAVREGEALITELIKVTRGALKGKEAEVRDIARRNLLSDALHLLDQHEAAMVKAYPMALLEIFADGPGVAKSGQSASSPLDFGELSLVDDDEVQAQVELSRAHQQALHATDAVLAELNGLVSAAQGLYRVQPERNPLRPENYIRALQQVVAETGVAAPIRELWMQHMRDLLGTQLVDVYKRASQSLRDHGVLPVGYGVASGPGMTGMGGLGRAGGASAHGGGYGPSAWAGAGATGYGGMGGPTGYGNPSMYGRGGMASGWSDPGAGAMAPDAEEALLTVGILRQMLAGGGDPFDASRGLPVAPSMRGGWVDPAGGTSTHGAPISGHYPSAAVSEAMEDIAQLERLVGRLAHSQPGYAPSGQGSTHSLYGVAYGSAAESPAMAAEVVARMVENISQDSRLLPPVQRAVQNLEPAIRKLVRHDPRFFSDGGHPARRLLDELTQRSLAYTSEDAPGFKRYMRLVDQAVNHLAQQEVTSAAPFEAVLKALESAWETQEKKLQARREAEEKALLDAEQREMLAEKVASNIRALPDIGNVPADIMDFAAGPWADVVALAQISKPEGSTDGDPGGYLALVPLLFWSVQPELVADDKAKLVDAIPGMLATVREGLSTIAYPEASTSEFIERLVQLHQQVLDAQPPVEPEEPAPLETQSEDPSVLPETVVDVDLATVPGEPAPPATTTIDDEFTVGSWVDLVSAGKVMRTQLTWASPHKTLFLFTAADGSTQSMTRRMRDKLAAEGSLRVLSHQHVVDRAIGAMASATRSKRPANTRK